MRSILSLSIICLTVVFFSCQKESKHSGYIDENEALVEPLIEVNGKSRTYNYDFKILEYPNVLGFYYKPISIAEALTSVPDQMREAIHLPSVLDLPFTPGTEKANIVTFWNDKNKLIFEIQISYLEDTPEYQANNKDFFIISATQLANNPFIDTSADDDPIDNWIEEFNMDGNDPEGVVIYRKLDLTPDFPLFFKDWQQSWSTMYAYYSYDSDDNEIMHTSTGAKVYYAWHDGLIYQIGYKFTDETIDMESVVRKIILGE